MLGLTGPAAAIFADGGAGNIELTTTLTRAPIADVYTDVHLGAHRWIHRRPLIRLNAVRVRGAVHLY